MPGTQLLRRIAWSVIAAASTLMGSAASAEPQRAGIVTFASNAVTEWTLAMSQDRPTITSAINGLPYTGGATYHLAALENAVDIFENAPPMFQGPSASRHVILLTDGNSSPPDTQNPCSPVNPAAGALRSALAAVSIQSVLIGFGPNPNLGALGCLVDNDPANMLLLQIGDLDNPAMPLFLADILITPVPEPRTLVMFGAGLAALLSISRRRPQAAAVS